MYFVSSTCPSPDQFSLGVKGSRWTLACSVFSLFSSRMTEDGHTLTPLGGDRANLTHSHTSEHMQHCIKALCVIMPIAPQFQIHIFMASLRRTSASTHIKYTATLWPRATQHPFPPAAPHQSCRSKYTYLLMHVELHWRSVCTITSKLPVH